MEKEQMIQALIQEQVINSNHVEKVRDKFDGWKKSYEAWVNKKIDLGLKYNLSILRDDVLVMLGKLKENMRRKNFVKPK